MEAMEGEGESEADFPVRISDKMYRMKFIHTDIHKSSIYLIFNFNLPKTDPQ